MTTTETLSFSDFRIKLEQRCQLNGFVKRRLSVKRVNVSIYTSASPYLNKLLFQFYNINFYKCKFIVYNTKIIKPIISFLCGVFQGDMRIITQHHMTTWPDQGIPPITSSVLNIHRNIYEENTDSPTIIQSRYI